MLGTLIRRSRKSLGLSQEEVAHRVKIDRTTLSKIERGLTIPTVDLLLGICRVLDVDASEMVREFAGTPGPNREPVAARRSSEGNELHVQSVLASNVRRIRASQELSQSRLAALSGVPQSVISAVENATVDCRLSTVHAIARGLRMSAGELLADPEGGRVSEAKS